MPIVRKSNSPFLWYDFRYGGRRYRGSTRTSSKAAARHVEAQILAQLELGDALPVRGRKAPLLRDFLPQFLASFDLNQLRAEATKRYYRTGAKLLLATPLAEFPVDQITTSIVAAAKFPHSAATANNAVRTLRRVLGHAVELGHLHQVPRMHLYRETGRDQLFTPDFEARLLAVATQPLADVFVLLMDTGMRPEEVCRLRWDNVRWTENLVCTGGGKTAASERCVGMSLRVLDLLKRRVKTVGGSPWVFPTQRGSEAGHLTTVNRAFAKARAAAGLPRDLVLYATRHTFGTDVMEATGNQKLTMKTMGHTDIQTSARYQHPGTARIADVINQRNDQREAHQKAQQKRATTKNGHTFGHTPHAIQ